MDFGRDRREAAFLLQAPSPLSPPRMLERLQRTVTSARAERSRLHEFEFLRRLPRPHLPHPGGSEAAFLGHEV
jgi:hypothetical protein